MSAAPHDNARPSLVYVFLIAFVAAVGGFLFGYDLNIISGAQIFLKDQFQLDADAFGFAMSSALIGCLAGPLLGGGFCDGIGRKKTLILAAILFGVSAIGTALPQTITQFNIFRFIGGLGVGLASVASPMYIAEIAPPRLRGRLVTMNQLAIVAGSLIAIIAAYYLARHLPPTTSWRWMFGSIAVPVAAFVIFLLIVPESPRWLMARGREAEARRVLTRIDGADHAEAELREIRGTMQQSTGRFGDLFHPGIRLPLFIGAVLCIFSQWTGWSMISFYLPVIVQKAGYHNATDAIYQAIIVNVFNAIFTIIALFLVDKLGRRKMYLWGALLMVLSTAALGLCFVYGASGRLTVIVVFLCALPHAIALGALPWLIISEIFPNRIRARAMAFCTIILWVAAAICTQVAPRIISYFETRFNSPAGMFFIFTCFSFIAYLFALKFLPETKGRSLEEIAASWQRGGANRDVPQSPTRNSSTALAD